LGMGDVYLIGLVGEILVMKVCRLKRSGKKRVL